MPTVVLASVLGTALSMLTLTLLSAAVLRLRRDIAAVRREVAHERARRIAAEQPPDRPGPEPTPEERRAAFRLIRGPGPLAPHASGHHQGPAAS
ncbi:hypothetical protein [Streptomyces sp. YIM 98790]|uniref:hypothetical protein n=1 Tax=Streptomyces sp. YIM 98790 TaxID=2689077 RepID=UPI00140D0BBA|nr:hypothetical protein [Streptomyces sp. YIM 98790]